MLNTMHSLPTQFDQVEELRSAISGYKKMIQKVEGSKLKNLNKSFQQNMRKKVNSRLDTRLHHSKNLILPSITTLNLTNFYEFILKISKVHKICLNLIPTLFLPKPFTVLFTNSNGVAEIYDGPKGLDKFFRVINKNKRPLNAPICLFKGPNKKIKLFQDLDQAKVFLKQHKELSGMLQEFILPPSDRTSVCKVLWKANKFKYFMVINKHPYKEVSRLRGRSASCFEGEKKFRSDESILLFDMFYKKDIQNKADELFKEKLKNTPGILSRIQLNILNPWKQLSSIKFCMDDEQSEKFILNGVSLDDCHVNDITTTYPEIEKMMSQIAKYLKKFKLHEKIQITEIVCDFLKDPKKKWKILNTPLIKIQSTEYAEIPHKGSSYYYNLKLECDSEVEAMDDTTVRYEEKSEKIEAPQHFFNQYSMKSQFSFKAENNTFQDKFKKTITKIDRIRKRDKINANVGLKYELIQNYRSKLKIDRNGNVDRLMLYHSPGKPFEHKFESSCNTLPKAASFDVLHSNSKQYDKFNSTSTVAKYTKVTVDSYEAIIKEIRKKKFQTRKLEEKYGGKKFILNFTESLLLRVSQSILNRFLNVNQEGEQIFCPGLKLIFDCKVNLALAKLLHMKHVGLRVNKEEYDAFVELFLASLKEFEFNQEDFEYMAELLLKLSRDVYLKKARRDTVI